MHAPIYIRSRHVVHAAALCVAAAVCCYTDVYCCVLLLMLCGWGEWWGEGCGDGWGVGGEGEGGVGGQVCRNKYELYLKIVKI